MSEFIGNREIDSFHLLLVAATTEMLNSNIVH